MIPALLDSNCRVVFRLKEGALMSNEERLEAALRRLSMCSLIITVGIATLSLIGWALGATILTSIKKNYHPITPSSIFCFFILSTSFLIYIFIPNARLRTITAFCAFLTLLISSVLFQAGLIFR